MIQPYTLLHIIELELEPIDIAIEWALEILEKGQNTPSIVKLAGMKSGEYSKEQIVELIKSSINELHIKKIHNHNSNIEVAIYYAPRN